MTVLIFANGDLEDGHWVQTYLKSASTVIAANGGSGHLWRLGYLPDVVIGDLDSLPKAVEEWLQENEVQMMQFPQNKDENDLELALLYAVEQSRDLIMVFAAAGGRMDQTLANIQLLAHPNLIDRQIELVTAHERAWLVTGTAEFKGEIGDNVSLIPLGGTVHIRYTRGLQWQLSDEELAFGPARGVSNRMQSKSATISVASGMLLCIHTYETWRR
ncbi:MAG: thiamine diphosphokinase [Candidatus Promineifilaceae bacterium]|nr:thiamine diphosphokinase [Candidatus Promineifilaceae bacterium]